MPGLLQVGLTRLQFCCGVHFHDPTKLLCGAGSSNCPLGCTHIVRMPTDSVSCPGPHHVIGDPAHPGHARRITRGDRDHLGSGLVAVTPVERRLSRRNLRHRAEGSAGARIFHWRGDRRAQPLGCRLFLLSLLQLKNLRGRQPRDDVSA